MSLVLLISGKTPTGIHPQQVKHTNGTPGKSPFFPHLDADSLVKQAWEMGTFTETMMGHQESC